RLRSRSSCAIAAVSVPARYAPMITAAATLAHAIARPMPMIAEPTYSGCAVQRYGPDEVTSLDLLRCPAAQIRIASPIAAIEAPMATVDRVGVATQKTSAADANPSGTRLR